MWGRCYVQHVVVHVCVCITLAVLCGDPPLLTSSLTTSRLLWWTATCRGVSPFCYNGGQMHVLKHLLLLVYWFYIHTQYKLTALPFLLHLGLLLCPEAALPHPLSRIYTPHGEQWSLSVGSKRWENRNKNFKIPPPQKRENPLIIENVLI